MGASDVCPASPKSHVLSSSSQCLKCYYLSLSHSTRGVLLVIPPLAPFHPGCFSDPPASLESRVFPNTVPSPVWVDRAKYQKVVLATNDQRLPVTQMMVSVLKAQVIYLETDEA